MKSRKKIGKIIREARVKLGVSQRSLAKEVGICRASLINAEFGRILPKYDSMVKICKKLGVSSSVLES